MGPTGFGVKQRGVDSSTATCRGRVGASASRGWKRSVHTCGSAPAVQLSLALRQPSVNSGSHGFSVIGQQTPTLRWRC